MKGHPHHAVGSGYYPDSSPLEGGFTDRHGKRLNTLQDFLNSKADYVSVAMDPKLPMHYGAKIKIPELDKRYGKEIEFRYVDTGDAFKGKGFSRIDICVESKQASLEPTINGALTLEFE